MKAGVIGTVEGEFTAVDSFSDTVTDGDRELSRVLDIRKVFSLPSGGMGFRGRAAVERPTERETTEIDFGEVRTSVTEATETYTTEFVGVPGEFVVAGSGTGAFAFDMVAEDTGTTIERASLDLDALLDARSEARPWKVGFSEGTDTIANGVLHGTDVLDDGEMGPVLENATVNQLGLEYEYGGESLKMTSTRSGYVEVYRPSSFDDRDFLQYVSDEILPHVD